MYKKTSIVTLLLSSALLSACAGNSKTVSNADEQHEPETVMHNYPTRDRVEYVFNCIAKHGGKLDYVVQYSCGCKIDKIAEQLTFAEYEAGTTYSMLKSTPGENGSVFRDPKAAKDLRARLKEADDAAEKSCFVK